MLAENEGRHGEEAEVKALAQESATELSRLLQRLPGVDRATVRLDHDTIIMPRRALELLREVRAYMAKGNAVTVVPTHAEVTTQQAAGLLNVSRPHVIKLLNDGKIPFHYAGRHRRIRYDDLMDYKAKQRKGSLEAMEDLQRQAQEEDMGY